MISTMKILFFTFISVIFYANDLHSKSSDSPNLELKVEKTNSWGEWIEITKESFRKKNISYETINLLNDLKLDERVIKLDRKQPEFKLTFNEYLIRVINKDSKDKINLIYKKNNEFLKKLETNFDINARVLVSLWGIETFFGKHTGKLDILRSLASLAYEGRRRDFFLKELENALIILDEHHFDRKLFRGSWAGAFGQTQFMPSTFLKYAIDYDGDSKKDLFNKKDALASGANYLKKIGWNNKLSWGEEVNIDLTEQLISLAKKKEYKNYEFWKNFGINLKKNYKNNSLRLVIPENNNNQCYLVSENFDVILDWNRSNYFALTV